jgi:hypothetical protein
MIRNFENSKENDKKITETCFLLWKIEKWQKKNFSFEEACSAVSILILNYPSEHGPVSNWEYLEWSDISISMTNFVLTQPSTLLCNWSTSLHKSKPSKDGSTHVRNLQRYSMQHAIMRWTVQIGTWPLGWPCIALYVDTNFPPQPKAKFLSSNQQITLFCSSWFPSRNIKVVAPEKRKFSLIVDVRLDLLSIKMSTVKVMKPHNFWIETEISPLNWIQNNFFLFKFEWRCHSYLNLDFQISIQFSEKYKKIVRCDFIF